MREAAINLRARPQQRELIDQAAATLGKTRSDFMLETACARAQEVLLDQVFFRLDADRYRQFTELLDAPARPNKGLERLMAATPPWEKATSKSKPKAKRAALVKQKTNKPRKMLSVA